MGLREIVLVVIAVVLGGLLTLSVAPSMTASGSAVKAGVLNGEVETVAAGSKLWMVNNSANGTFTGISPTNIGAGVPLEISSDKFVSKVASTINYAVAAATTSSTDDSFQVTISGLDAISGSETSMKSMLEAKYGTANITDAAADDGILIVKIRG